MCTVTYVRSGQQVILTSNRDEEVLRPAIAPKNYAVNGVNIMFPKDPRAGGTWFAVTETAKVLVLLNGAAEKHRHNPPYRKSRGLVVLDLISAPGNAIAAWETIVLDAIEPFTLVLFEDFKLYQLRWDGLEKQTAALDPHESYVWSSSTLYPKEIRTQREGWFYHFLATQPDVDAAQMFDFHRYTEQADTQNGLVINRNDMLRTLSITQVAIDGNKVNMRHCDLARQTEHVTSFIKI